jgi:hypothetical protein
MLTKLEAGPFVSLFSALFLSNMLIFFLVFYFDERFFFYCASRDHYLDLGLAPSVIPNILLSDLVELIFTSCQLYDLNTFFFCVQVDVEPVLAIDFNIKDILLVTSMLPIFCVDHYLRSLPCIVHCYVFLPVTLVRFINYMQVFIW